MTEELKYKVGDKVLVEANVIDVDITDNITLYKIDRKSWTAKDEIIELPPKPKITQAVMDWYGSSFSDNNNDTVGEVFVYFASASLSNNPVSIWLHDTEYGKLERSKRQHALATLITYGPEAVEVEKEKRYRVYLVGVKNQWNQRQCLTNNEDNYFFSGRCMVDTTYTKQELIEAGFEGVFDNPMFDVEEVE